jgi:hypothetical protein
MVWFKYFFIITIEYSNILIVEDFSKGLFNT